MQNTGFRMSSIVTDAVIQANFIKAGTTYEEVQQLIYRLFDSVAQEQEVGDWLETANGPTYTLTFKPTDRNANEANFTMQPLRGVNENL